MAALLPLLCGIWACRKDNPPPNIYPPPIDYTVLPPETQTGAGTFCCKVDGVVWVPRVPLLAVTYRDIEATVWEKDGSGAGSIVCNLVDIEKGQDNWPQITFSSTFFNPVQNCHPTLGVFMNLRITNGQYNRSDFVEISSDCINITKIDSVKNFVSGTFKFTLYKDNINLDNKIKITEGRFDLPYYSQ